MGGRSSTAAMMDLTGNKPKRCSRGEDDDFSFAGKGSNQVIFVHSMANLWTKEHKC